MIVPYGTQFLAFEAVFVEDDFVLGQRLDAATDGPDPRPTVRENVSIPNDLR
jgi:hypothetical protein